VARALARLEENAPGEFFVDDACIDCETCRILAPSVFSRSNRVGMSIVRSQPRSAEQLQRAKMALVACPTSAIGSESKLDIAAAVAAFPERITDDVFYCGFASKDSFGASSYLIVRDGGNVLVDSPRAARPLMDRIAAMGGVRTMFLSHRDDVADHAKYAHRFDCERLLGSADAGRGMRDVERLIEGEEPTWLAPDLQVIPVPGHTRGSLALLYRGEFLFTGDHLWASEDGELLQASRSVCWYSWESQITSMERLLEFEFQWVLPGHGYRLHAPAPLMRQKLGELLTRMKIPSSGTRPGLD
jgi:glyoxylase-like metal-dependent hydrolase (beta-lactamase superfamily II)/ferredoxin